MPRTKYIRKTKGTNDSKEYDMMMQTFDRHVQLRISKLERDARADVKSLETFVDALVNRLPTEIRQMTLSEILGWQGDDNQKENDDEVSSSVKDCMLPPTAPRLKAMKKTAKRGTTTASDDGYATEGGTSSGSTSRVARTQMQEAPTRRTRSCTRASRAKLVELNQKTVLKGKNHLSVQKTDNFKTPATMKPPPNTYGLVTPKIKPNTPLNVLRRPRQGEMVLSMQGSPLLVSAVIEEKTANINVPLADGNVLSLLPQEGLRKSHIPPLDPETMHQLQTLKDHIEKVISLK